MSEGIVDKAAGTLLLLLLLTIKGFSQNVQEPSVQIMFYNVENLFDVYDDTLTEDEEFLPSGIRRWNTSRYYNKLNSLQKTILAAGEWSPPAIVAFCEIENRKVLGDLIYRTNLSKHNYRIVHEDSPDPRGIDVCLIYRDDFVELIEFKYFKPHAVENEKFSTRSVLYARCVIVNDTLDILVNHWPSRRGGVLAAKDQRMMIAEMTRMKADSILAANGSEGKLIVLGDFNAAPDDQVIGILTGNDSSGSEMINLSDSLEKGSGTYRYKGTWEMIDQVIVSKSLLQNERGVYCTPEMLSVFKPEFLLRKDTKYPGISPFSTWSGYRYTGGFSDHLPVLLELRVR